MGLSRTFVRSDSGRRTSHVTINPAVVGRVESEGRDTATIVTKDGERITVMGSVQEVTNRLNGQ